MVIDSYITATVAFGLCVILSVVGLIIARKMLGTENLRQCHEVGGYLLSVVGTMYAVLLGLVVVDSMTRFQQGRSIVEEEANSLADVFILSERFPEEKRRKIQNHCLNYVAEVVDVEWNMMDEGKVSMAARRQVFSLLREVMDFEPVTENQKAIYPIIVDEACQLWDQRRARTNMSSYGMPVEEWVVLIVGGIVSTMFTYFFALESLKLQITMTVMVAVIIALNLFLVLMFGYPFSGDMKVHPDALKVDELIFKNKLGILKDMQLD